MNCTLLTARATCPISNARIIRHIKHNIQRVRIIHINKIVDLKKLDHKTNNETKVNYISFEKSNAKKIKCSQNALSTYPIKCELKKY